MSKKHLLAGVVVLSLLGTGGYFRKNHQAKISEHQAAESLKHVVARGNIVAEVKVPATTTIKDEQQLTFGQEGKITEVFVSEGDWIKQGDILAQLDMKNYTNSVRAAELDLSNANLALTQMLTRDIELAEAQIENQAKDTQRSIQIEKDSYSLLEQQLNNRYNQQKNDLESAKLTLTLAQNNYELTKQQQKTTLSQKQQQLQDIDRDVDISQQQLQTLQSGAVIDQQSQEEQTQKQRTTQQLSIETALGSIQDQFLGLEQQVDTVDAIFGVGSPYNNQYAAYRQYLGALNTQIKRDTEDSIRKSQFMLQRTKNELNQLTPQSDSALIEDFLFRFYENSELVAQTIDKAYQTMTLSVASGPLSQQQIDGFIITLQQANSSLAAIRSQIKNGSTTLANQLSQTIQDAQLTQTDSQNSLQIETQRNQIQKLKSQKKLLEKEIADITFQQSINEQQQQQDLRNQLLQIEILDKQLTTLKNDHSVQLQRQTKNIISQQDRASLLTNEIQDIRKGPTQTEIQQQQNRISQAELNLTRTLDQAENYQIIANFDGRVRTVDFTEGEQYKLEDRKKIVVENPELIELEVEVSQIDIVAIQVGDRVSISFDAYPSQEIVASITSRDMNPITNARGGVSYSASILLPKQDIEIFAGMSALVTIETDSAENIVVVPTLALISQQGKEYVYKRTGEDQGDDGYSLQEVEIGVRNNFEAEIISGIDEGEIIKSSALGEDLLEQMGINEASDSPFGKRNERKQQAKTTNTLQTSNSSQPVRTAVCTEPVSHL